MSIELSKGQRIDLSKQTGGADLRKIFAGAGWDTGSGEDIDLDLSLIGLGEDKSHKFSVYFGNKSAPGIKHSGDNLTGEGEGDDERIYVNLSDVPSNVKFLVFTISSYRGQTFDDVENAFVRICVDERAETELATYKISALGHHTALIVASLYRHEGAWKFRAIGETAEGRTVQNLVTYAQSLV